LLVVVNDAYRPTPTQELLAPFAEALSTCGEVRFVVATGMHPPPGTDDIARLLGSWAERYPVQVHKERSECSDFGLMRDGTRLELNALLTWPRRILLVGSVEPHFFAGFTGGPKQLLPGLASRACTEANHRHATHPLCSPLQLKGNPVALGIREAGERFADRLLSTQAVAGPTGWEPFWGEEPHTFDRACRRARAVAEHQWDEPLDGLIAVMQPPLDRNLYQLQKGFENHLGALRDGGWVLLMSACADGVGNDFFGRLAALHPDRHRLPAWESQHYSLGLHKLYRTAAARRRCELFLYSQLPADVVRSVYLEPVADLQSWLDERTRGTAAIGVVESADRLVSTVGRPQ
jgi:nickel-dependent lactate racemase